MYHRPNRSRRTKWARTMAAALTLSRLPSGHSFHHPTVQTLSQIVAPPSSKTLPESYVDAFSLVINHAEADQYHATLMPVKFDSDSRLIGLDGRASASITNDQADVVPGTQVLTNKRVKCFGGTFDGKVYRCTIKWTILDKQSKAHTFTLPNSYYIPEGGMRLLSPQHWSQELIKQSNGKVARAPRVTTDNKQMVMRWNNGASELTVDLDKRTNVGNIHLAPGYTQYQLFLQTAGVEDEDTNPITMEPNEVTDDQQSLDEEHPDEEDWDSGWTEGDQEEPRDIDFSLMPDDKATSETQSTPTVDTDEEHKVHNHAAELLRIHHQFNHIGFAKLQQMAKCGIIPKRYSTCQVPICSACMYGKATKRPWRHKAKKQPPSKLKKITHAGQCVSVDMLKSPTPGLVAQMAGWITGKRYWYATVFVDHYSRLGYVHLQKTQTAKETLEGKALFERKCATFGVSVLHYHADNGIFASLAWREACTTSHQGFSYAGVNAHFQTGVAERRIGVLQALTRPILFHAVARWPEAINAHLWPYALRLANEANNEAPAKGNKRSPIELFTKTAVMPELKHWRPFGCPVYVLDTALQNNGIKHKWEERSRIGIYLGRSPFHARSVALVLNINTGRVSPQFHVQFDPSFQTVKESFGGKSPPIQWQAVCGFTRATEEDRKQREPTLGQQQEAQLTLDPVANVIPSATEPAPVPQTEGATQSEGAQVNPETGQPLRRSVRFRRPVIGNRLVDALMLEVIQATVDEEGNESSKEGDPAEGEIFSYSTLFPINDEDDSDPIQAYAASADPDTLYHHEAMKEPDAAQFRVAMEKEFIDQWDNGNFQLKRRDQIPEDARVLPAVWAMKRKRKILTGEVYKHKARMNLDGSKQIEGVDFSATYSPTASWPAVRLLLALTLVNNWYTRQIDFVQAFPQAPLTSPQYMKLPKGIHVEGVDDPRDYVLEVLRNMCGGKDAGRNWHLYLKGKLESIGFQRSAFDECVFYRGTCMYVLYTDDSILAGPSEEELEQAIQDIRSTQLEITEEGSVADFLGVNIKRDGDLFHLTQPKLIESILEDLSLPIGSSTKDIPMASSKILSRHKESVDFDQHFPYRRVIGKLNFLEQSTRGDISYATHMLARFSTCPKVEHGKAVKWLGRYLLKTKDKGITLKPDPSKGMEIYCDADFAGAWDPALAGEDIDTARSRHGYIITYAGIPLIWKSQMQGEIALSSTESELIGLSAGLRTAIPLQHILNEMKELGFPIFPQGPVVHCEAFEDNNGALAIAKFPRMRPRTKHINNKYFHFLEYTSREDAPFTFSRIDTEQQPADVLTKPLPLDPFEKHRKWLLGW